MNHIPIYDKIHQILYPTPSTQVVVRHANIVDKIRHILRQPVIVHMVIADKIRHLLRLVSVREQLDMGTTPNIADADAVAVAAPVFEDTDVEDAPVPDRTQIKRISCDICDVDRPPPQCNHIITKFQLEDNDDPIRCSYLVYDTPSSV